MKKRDIIYLDNGSTTRVYDEVVEEMNKYQLEDYGNPGSVNFFGDKASQELEIARKRIAEELGVKSEEIIFTSGATESNNLALLGTAEANKDKKRNKIIISKIEHSSIFGPAMELKKKGYSVKEINVDEDGLIDMNELEREIDEKTLIVSINHANNEIGVLQDLLKIGRICRKKNVLFHTDCAQSFGKVKIKAKDLNIDMLSACAHKIHGPKGVGLLFLRNGIQLNPLFFGGKQEKGLRPGTENVSGIIGFSKAFDKIGKADKRKIEELRDCLIEGLEKIGGKINGDKERRLYNNVSVCFSGRDADELVLKLSARGIMCSTKSACLSRQNYDNRVLKALGLNEKERKGSLRFVLSEFNTKREIDHVLKIIRNII